MLTRRCFQYFTLTIALSFYTIDYTASRSATELDQRGSEVCVFLHSDRKNFTMWTTYIDLKIWQFPSLTKVSKSNPSIQRPRFIVDCTAHRKKNPLLFITVLGEYYEITFSLNMQAKNLPSF
jgi:hypothetical protein